MSVINYAVEIITEQTAFTNTAYGLKDGVFRYITGRPNYGSIYGTPYAFYKQTNTSPIHYWRFHEMQTSTPGTVVGQMGVYDEYGDSHPVEVLVQEGSLYGESASESINDSTYAVRGFSYANSVYLSDMHTTGAGTVVIDGWFKLESLPATNTPLLYFKKLSGNLLYFSLDVMSSNFSNMLNATIRDPVTDEYITVYGPPPTADVWHYIVYVFKNNTAYLYMDGVLLNSQSGTITNIFRYVDLMYVGQGGSNIVSVSDIGVSKTDWYTGLEHLDWYNYLGNGNTPKWEDGTDNTHVWYEGWLMKDKLSNPTRSCDLSQTGDYATMSGFNFSIRNDVKLWVYIRDNAIYLTNRTVHFYVVIDDVFHPAWSGAIANNPYDEINYEFICQDPFKKLHKMIPPIVIDETSFPGSSTDSQGTPIPVVIGDCTYAKLTVISNEPVNDTLILGKFNPNENFEIKACGAKIYKAKGLTHPTLELYTKDVSYVADALKDHYCYAAKGGGSIDSDILIKIASNDATTAAGITKIYLEAPFEFTTEEIFNQKYSYEPRQGYDLELVNINASSCTSYTSAQIGQFGEMWDIRSGAMLTYEHLDMSNNGAGCNQLLFEASANEARRIKVHLGTSTGRIIGEVPIPKNNEYAWYTCDIEKQYGSDVTITLEFYLGNAKYHGYVNKLNKIKMTHNKSDIDTWFFSTIYMPYTHVISTAGIKEIVSDAAGPMVFIYNDKTLQMEQVSGIVLDTVISTTGSMGHPQMGLYTSRMKKDGAVVYLVPIVPKKWEIFLERTDNGYIRLDSGDTTRHVTDLSKDIDGFDLCDRNHTNYCRIYFPDYEDAIKNTYKFSFRVSFPPEHLLVEYDSIYLGFDLLAIATEVGTKIRMFAEYKMLDPYGNTVDMLDNGDPDPTVYWPLDETVQSDHVGFDSLPNEYYANGGHRIVYEEVQWPFVGYDGNGEEASIKGLLKLSDDIVSALRDGTTTNVIQVNVWITSTGAQAKDEFGNDVPPSPEGVPFHLTVGLKEAGFVGYRAINPSSDDFYVRVKGETIDGLESNTVYRAFRLLLESYDKIPGSMIDYTNLPYCRDDWNVGRQISDRKSSQDFLTDLARQSFVIIYGTRDGKRGLRAWRDPYMKLVAGVWTDQEPTKLSLPVIVDSIQWENTEMADLYNDFRIWYDYNEATGKYQCSIVVTNADQAAFPAIGEMAPAPTSMEKWKTWVGGIGGGSYADAKQIWDTIAESYRRTWAIQPLPDALSKLSWFPNNMLFLGLTNAVLSTKDSPYKFMDNCIRWVCRQKAKVVFQTPLTASSIVAELLRTVEFSDPLYTNSGTRTGWISGIEIDTKKDLMKLTYILEPEDIIIDNLIIERGKLLNVNTHIETGNQVDQVKDGQNRT